MPLTRHFIGGFDSGQQGNVDPWLLPEDAFETLENALVWRKKVQKRFGTSLLGTTDLTSRLRINVGTTDGNGDLAATQMPGIVFKIGQMFSIGTTVFTSVATTLPIPAFTLLTTGMATGLYNTTTGMLTIVGNAENPTTVVYFYPSLPVMGLLVRESQTINRENVIGFDTQFAYQRTGGGWDRILGNLAADGIWSGTDSDFFWSTNFREALANEFTFYVINNIPADGIRHIRDNGTVWRTIKPNLGAGRTLESGKMVFGFKNRLIILAPQESSGGAATSNPNRIRFCAEFANPLAVGAWIDNTPNNGGFIDAPTAQQIVTADLLKDRLIVYFERSTYEVVYTALPDAPFRWQLINDELGAESRFSVIGFDQGIVGVGNVGIHQCTGTSVSRIDQKIPDEVFKIHNGNNGTQRVYGIRDYFPELVYWTFPSATTDPTYPNRVLVYNYENQSWAFYKDTFTCFGYFQEDNDLTWSASTPLTWESFDRTWTSGQSQSAFPAVLGGNQQGFTLRVEHDLSTNAQSLYIHGVTVIDSSTVRLDILNHNMENSEFVRVEDTVGTTGLNNLIFEIKDAITSTDFIEIQAEDVTVAPYEGGGKVRRVSDINIVTKQFNPGTPEGRQFRIPYIDFLVDTTENGEITLNYLVDASIGASVSETTNPGVLLGNNVLKTSPEDLFPEQINSNYNWHRFFVQAHGQFIQLKFSLSQAQITNWDIASEDFVIQGFVLFIEPDARSVG